MIAESKKMSRPIRRRLHSLFSSKNKPAIRDGIAEVMNSGFSHDDIKREYETWRDARVNG